MTKHIVRGSRKTSRVKKANAAWMKFRRAREAEWAAFDRIVARVQRKLRRMEPDVGA